jgi:hypothetical protein
MGRVLRVVLVASVLLGVVLTAGVAQAQQGPTVTVTPATGLQDGQTVTVTGSGFSSDVTLFGLAQCNDDAAPNVCIGSTVVPGSGGSFSASFTVQRFVGTTDCAAAPGTCFIGGSNLNGGGGALEEFDFAPLSFGPEQPASKDDCKRGGWRNLADDQGQSFRNQGQCVSFVQSRRP